MPETSHSIAFNNAQNMDFIPDNSIQLIVTSPPYPMIKMWDNLFSKDSKVKKALDNHNGNTAFELMHKSLDKVWKECYRVLEPGGFACINIGDATRKIGDNFRLYPNHSRITNSCNKIGFTSLPIILWIKQTNLPNKFMGSGMLPAGAYVTLEHEYILIFRKANKREFKKKTDKDNRQQSALFWEERNTWFSDIWNFKGVKQNLTNAKIRKRSGAYPFELAYRLINMYSVKRDTVLDPFLGTGTTTIAAIASERNSIGIEIDKHFKSEILSSINLACKYMNSYIKDRLNKHISFVKQYNNKKMKYKNKHHKIEVISKQEINLKFNLIKEINLKHNNIIAYYHEKCLNSHIPFIDHNSTKKIIS